MQLRKSFERFTVHYRTTGGERLFWIVFSVTCSVQQMHGERVILESNFLEYVIQNYVKGSYNCEIYILKIVFSEVLQNLSYSAFNIDGVLGISPHACLNIHRSSS